MSRDSILRALVSGKMKFQGDSLSEAERAALVTYLAAPSDPVAQPHPVGCAPKPMQVVDDPGWNGWGVDASNSRFQPVSAGGLDRGLVPKLKLKWTFAFPGASSTFGQPTVLGGRVFVGSEDGTVYSLDARTGCTYWVYKALTTVKTAVFIAQDGHSIYFGDTGGNVYALDATSGSLLWRTAVDPHPAARITGSPLLLNDRLYVPVSSGEEGAATDPRYPCCTFRGSVVALEARTGRQIWKTYTIPDLPKPTGRRSSAGIRLWGPSGAAVWSPPTADPKARAIYVATGNSYSDPISPSSDAVMAFDMDTGKVLWSQQFTPDDSWNIACIAPIRSNGPDRPGDDYYFGAPPILASSRDGSRLLIVGQKSGVIHALDPDRAGRIVWQTRIGHGGPLGGVEWGGGADEKFVYYPRSDWEDSKFDAGGGLFALDISTGEKVWYTPPAKPTCGNNPGCSAAQMAPVTVIPGVVFSGSLDGHLRAYDSSDGQVIWDFDAVRDFQAVNAAKAQGGSFNGAGPTVAGAMLYVQSGYTNDIAGNVLLAFSINGK